MNNAYVDVSQRTMWSGTRLRYAVQQKNQVIRERALNRWGRNPEVPVMDIARELVRSLFSVRVTTSSPERLSRENQVLFFAILAIVADTRADLAAEDPVAEAVATFRRLAGAAT